MQSSLIEEIFRDARFVQSLGIELSSWGRGWCETKVNILPTHKQQHGFIHAGVLMTLGDHTCGGAAATTVPEGKDVITVENKISFLRPASGLELSERDSVRVVVAKTSSTLAVIPRTNGLGRKLEENTR